MCDTARKLQLEMYLASARHSLPDLKAASAAYATHVRDCDECSRLRDAEAGDV